TVHVAGRSDRLSGARLVLLPRRRPGRTRRETRRGAEEDEGASVPDRWQSAKGPEAIGSDDDVGVSVSVHVAGPGDRESEAATGLVPLERPCRRDRESRRGAEVEQGASLIGEAAVIIGSADDDVRVTVAVDIAGRGHRPAETLFDLALQYSPGGAC